MHILTLLVTGLDVTLMTVGFNISILLKTLSAQFTYDARSLKRFSKVRHVIARRSLSAIRANIIS